MRQLHLVISPLEVIEIKQIIILRDDSKSDDDKYNKFTDPKWIKFCKDHRFHYVKDSYGKIYELYLQLCAEGLI